MPAKIPDAIPGRELRALAAKIAEATVSLTTAAERPALSRACAQIVTGTSAKAARLAWHLADAVANEIQRQQRQPVERPIKPEDVFKDGKA